MNMEAQAATPKSEGEEKQANFEANQVRAAEIQREIVEAAASGDFAKIVELSAEGQRLKSANENVVDADRQEATEMSAEFDAEKARAEAEKAKAAEAAAAERAALMEAANDDRKQSAARADAIVASLKGDEASGEEKIEMDMAFAEAEREGKEGWDGERAKESVEAERAFLVENQASLKEELGEEAMQKIIEGFKKRKFDIEKLGNRYQPDQGIHAQIAEVRRKIQHEKDMVAAEAEIRSAKREQLASEREKSSRKEAERAEWDPTVRMEQEQAASDEQARIAAGVEGQEAFDGLDVERQYLNHNREALIQEFGEEAAAKLRASFGERNRQVKSGGRYFLNKGLMSEIAKLREGR